MQGEIGFIEKVLTMINGELRQLERMLDVMKSDEVQMAYFRGERMRLTQVKMIMEERQTELKSISETRDKVFGEW